MARLVAFIGVPQKPVTFSDSKARAGSGPSARIRARTARFTASSSG